MRISSSASVQAGISIIRFSDANASHRGITTAPVRDETEAFWMGDQATVWCSAECRDNYAERAAS